ncbi:MAG: hypothetical protein WAQ08_10650 [Aquabacterium sp.]|jgi:hypothetical protein|uniref:hypothetical protein n=1 Tax=Aquabacterium sp. TaxID=1872578 RepID=UPI003BAE4756
MSAESEVHRWRLLEVWGDTVDQRHLAFAALIGASISLAGFLVAEVILAKVVSQPDLARSYAMLAGLVCCLLSGLVCALAFPPKRQVVEDRQADEASRLQVLAQLDQGQGLGRIEDLSPDVLRELEDIQLRALFERYGAGGNTARVIDVTAKPRGNAKECA